MCFKKAADKERGAIMTNENHSVSGFSYSTVVFFLRPRHNLIFAKSSNTLSHSRFFYLSTEPIDLSQLFPFQQRYPCRIDKIFCISINLLPFK